MVFQLDIDFVFPPVYLSEEDGLLAVGGDLSPERLLLAYQSGIFPWFNEGDVIMWWSPRMRMVVDPEYYVVPKSLRSTIKKTSFEITWNTCFEEVIRQCSETPRKGEQGTWISDEIIRSYSTLHKMGYAKSVEVWQNCELVGGLYGVDLGHVFCGESMFSKTSNASKVAFVWLVNHLKENGYAMLDCQMYNHHLALLGAQEIERENFMKILKDI